MADVETLQHVTAHACMRYRKSSGWSAHAFAKPGTDAMLVEDLLVIVHNACDLRASTATALPAHACLYYLRPLPLCFALHRDHWYAYTSHACRCVHMLEAFRVLALMTLNIPPKHPNTEQ